ncbi:chromosome segregation protein SMC [Wenzhouxiangella limi]|uniref:Chromosome partition protein Smc n=1 Tax=Wenzhouxiangella limi TaxID=2707351 RepID=A0A845USD0_9GAMM|nr:chromosome segregation protein SMC [Wenzhouxiangella limi]NDY94743.1 chromosome segregation protein SMC [Wenzhouxiangella limi]
MRLTAIKLSGFKSFVEPTTVRFPSNMMGIVGPNGCGKSNIIDAVRWVMGESSARQLRGESMSDVIFSGSSARKPVTTATVELMFDNSDGRAGGEYASYSEISVRRQVSRDGQSAYFLNGTRCRRKDITDLFLGTGLGPRSYAIIEQGMISQIVEARPEELRAFLEEAAGISRYKERRRETENRIRHTRENLERLADLREEVGKQLEKLKRQARAAERYRKLKARYREDEARLTALRWRETTRQAETRQKELQQVENQLQSALADQRAAEKELESLRQQQHEAGETASKIQAELYEVAGEIARLEQSIEHQRDIRQRQQTEYDETEHQLNELKQHLILDKAQVSQTTELIAELTPRLETARDEEKTFAQALETAEQALIDWQQRWQEHQHTASQAANRAELLRQRIEHLDDRMGRAAERLQVLRSQNDDQALEKLQADQAAAKDGAERSAQALREAREAAETGRREISGQRTRIESLRNDLETARARRHEHAARLDSLRLLNRQPDEQGEAAEWLSKHGEDPASRLLERIRVTEARWTAAVEHVLADWLQGVASERLEALADAEPPALGLAVFAADQDASAPAGTLASHVRGAGALSALLARVQCVENLAEARAKSGQLDPEISLITPDGTWMGRGWLRQPALEADRSGLLQREEEIRTLQREISADENRIGELQSELKEARSQLQQVEQMLHKREAAIHQAERERAQAQGRISTLDSRLEALQRQRSQAAEEIDALERRQHEDGQAVATARGELQEALAAMEQAEQGREPLRGEKTQLDSAREQARARYRQQRELREEVSLKLESSRAGLDSLRQAIARIDNQVGQLQNRYMELSEALAQGDEPVQMQQKERDQLLERRLAVETRLRDARQSLEELEASWREQDKARQAAASSAEEVRERQQQLQLALHETRLRAETLSERITELGGQPDDLLAELPENAETGQYQQELEQLEARIRKLEPVNLAAIEEHDTEAERKAYLDRQHADLEEAMETLEKAIGRIDRDSRTRFRETFEQVNKNMQTLFPRLFGGGHGHLEMVGEDWLSAGVAIMARPPGKRIARIHLMSGGEKALTAVAFVFAIFNLNPAPFCLLDEVDAPLDDANVGRFSDMVREMSDQVQFLLVTHNKVTMEVTHQMLGVTMREPGVSRIVSVDLDRAVALAES